MDKGIQELLDKLAMENFFVKSSKGNYLTATKQGNKWIVQGREITREADIEYLNNQLEKNRKDILKTYNNIMDELEYGLWDSGNLSISQQKILDYLLEKGICIRTPGVPGEHDTANGTARWIYSLNINEEIERNDSLERDPLLDRKKSQQGKIAWKRHHASYMRGTRERERNMENKTFYGMAKDLEAKLESNVNEAQMTQDNVFDSKLEIVFENITGGIGLSVDDKTGSISISVVLKEIGSGNYKLANANSTEDIKNVYTNIKQDLLNLCQNFDNEVKQVITRYGLKSTK